MDELDSRLARIQELADMIESRKRRAPAFPLEKTADRLFETMGVPGVLDAIDSGKAQPSGVFLSSMLDMLSPRVGLPGMDSQALVRGAQSAMDFAAGQDRPPIFRAPNPMESMGALTDAARETVTGEVDVRKIAEQPGAIGWLHRKPLELLDNVLPEQLSSFVVDALLDPTNLIPFGALSKGSKAAKLAEKVARVTPVEAGIRQLGGFTPKGLLGYTPKDIPGPVPRVTPVSPPGFMPDAMPRLTGPAPEPPLDISALRRSLLPQLPAPEEPFNLEALKNSLLPQLPPPKGRGPDGVITPEPPPGSVPEGIPFKYDPDEIKARSTALSRAGKQAAKTPTLDAVKQAMREVVAELEDAAPGQAGPYPLDVKARARALMKAQQPRVEQPPVREVAPEVIDLDARMARIEKLLEGSGPKAVEQGQIAGRKAIMQKVGKGEAELALRKPPAEPPAPIAPEPPPPTRSEGLRKAYEEGKLETRLRNQQRAENLKPLTEQAIEPLDVNERATLVPPGEKVERLKKILAENDFKGMANVRANLTDEIARLETEGARAALVREKSAPASAVSETGVGVRPFSRHEEAVLKAAEDAPEATYRGGESSYEKMGQQQLADLIDYREAEALTISENERAVERAAELRASYEDTYGGKLPTLKLEGDARDHIKALEAFDRETQKIQDFADAGGVARREFESKPTPSQYDREIDVLSTKYLEGGKLKTVPAGGDSVRRDALSDQASRLRDKIALLSSRTAGRAMKSGLLHRRRAILESRLGGIEREIGERASKRATLDMLSDKAQDIRSGLRELPAGSAERHSLEAKLAAIDKRIADVEGGFAQQEKARSREPAKPYKQAFKDRQDAELLRRAESDQAAGRELSPERRTALKREGKLKEQLDAVREELKLPKDTPSPVQAKTTEEAVKAVRESVAPPRMPGEGLDKVELQSSIQRLGKRAQEARARGNESAEKQIRSHMAELRERLLSIDPDFMVCKSPCKPKVGAGNVTPEDFPLKGAAEERFSLNDYWAGNSGPMRFIPEVFRPMKKAHDAFFKDMVSYVTRLDKMLGHIQEGSATSRKLALYLDGRIDASGKLTAKGMEPVRKDGSRILKDMEALTPAELATSKEYRAVFDELIDRINANRPVEERIKYRKDYVPYVFDTLYDAFKKRGPFFDTFNDDVKFRFELPRNDPRLIEDLDLVKSTHAYLPAALKKVHYEPVLKKLIKIKGDKVVGGVIKDLYDVPGKQHKVEFSKQWVNKIIGNRNYDAMFNQLQANVESIKTSPVLGKFFKDSQLKLKDPTTWSAAMTHAVARSTLGGNLGSALRNVVSGTLNTVVGLSEGGQGLFENMWNGWRRTGYGVKAMLTKEGRAMARDEDVTRGFQGFLSDVMSKGGFWRKVDEVAFKALNLTEFFNRGVAFHAGMADYLAKNASNFPNGKIPREVIQKAIEHGHLIADETQHVYGMINRAPSGLMSSPLAGQFAHWHVNQIEFTGEKLQKAYRGLKAGDLKQAAPLMNGILATGAASWALASVGMDSGYLRDWIPLEKQVEAKLTGIPADKRNAFGVPSVGPGYEVFAKLISGDIAEAAKDLGALLIPYHNAIKNARIGFEGGKTRESIFAPLPEQVWDRLLGHVDKKYRHGVGQSRPLSSWERLLMSTGLRTTRAQAESDLSSIRSAARDALEPKTSKATLDKSRAERTFDAIPKAGRSITAIKTELRALGRER